MLALAVLADPFLTRRFSSLQSALVLGPAPVLLHLADASLSSDLTIGIAAGCGIGAL
jgi:hypothetical protein